MKDKPVPRTSIEFETQLWKVGFECVGGMDEAGRGAWAGPVTASVVVLPNQKQVALKLYGVCDSKKMSPRQRNLWAVKIKTYSSMWSVGFSSPQEIDDMGIVSATKLAMLRSLAQLSQSPDYLLIDALFLSEVPTPQSELIRGDSRSLSIAAASVLAKTARDEFMIQLDHECPQFSFAKHKGYGTSLHNKALKLNGLTEFHRRSYAPIKRMISTK